MASASPAENVPASIASPLVPADGSPGSAFQICLTTEKDRPKYSLFSPTAIAVVAFLAGPVGAATMLTLNFWRLGRGRAATVTVIASTIGTVALIPILLALPDSTPGYLVAFPLLLIVWSAAKSFQGECYREHLRLGGKAASFWASTGIAGLGIVLYLAAFLSGAIAYEFFQPPEVEWELTFPSGDVVCYSNDVSDADAHIIGASLSESEFLSNQEPKVMRIAIDQGCVVLSFVVHESEADDSTSHQGYRTIGRAASEAAFGARPVTVHLCDERWNVVRRLY